MMKGTPENREEEEIVSAEVINSNRQDAGKVGNHLLKQLTADQRTKVMTSGPLADAIREEQGRERANKSETEPEAELTIDEINKHRGTTGAVAAAMTDLMTSTEQTKVNSSKLRDPMVEARTKAKQAKGNESDAPLLETAA